MDNIRLISLGLVTGVRDSVFGIRAVIHLIGKTKEDKKDEPSVGYRIWQCCLLNGGVCLLSIAAFNYLMLPALWSFLTLLFGSSSGLATTIWGWIRPILVSLFSAVWILPLFLLSRVVNMLWFQDIANSAYKQLRGRPQSLPKFSKFIADTLFSIFFELLFLMQSMLVGLLPIPVIGYLVSLLHLSLLYSLYVFEYKWFNMGWELHKRLSFIENNWPYFAGFGFPLAILTSVSSSFIISACLFSIIFPLFIVSGNKATPMAGTCSYPLPLFSPVVWLCNMVLHQVINPRARGLYSVQQPSTKTETRLKKEDRRIHSDWKSSHDYSDASHTSTTRRPRS